MSFTRISRLRRKLITFGLGGPIASLACGGVALIGGEIVTGELGCLKLKSEPILQSCSRPLQRAGFRFGPTDIFTRSSVGLATPSRIKCPKPPCLDSFKSRGLKTRGYSPSFSPLATSSPLLTSLLLYFLTLLLLSFPRVSPSHHRLRARPLRSRHQNPHAPISLRL